MPTKPTIPIQNPRPESEVLESCIAWLKARHCLADRLNNGSFETAGGWRRYGILGGGDVIGSTEDGRHFEVECKRGSGGSQSVAQQRRELRVKSHGGIYLIVHDVTELEVLWPEEVSECD